jgi:hypothetical protein
VEADAAPSGSTIVARPGQRRRSRRAIKRGRHSRRNETHFPALARSHSSIRIHLRVPI